MPPVTSSRRRRGSASSMASNSAKEPQKGFSHSTQAPACMAAMLIAACCFGGVAMSTMSGFTFASIVA